MNKADYHNNINVNITKNMIFKGTVILLTFASLIPLILILTSIFVKGFQIIITPGFFTKISPAPQSEADIAMTGVVNVGGVANAIVGSILVVGIGAIFAIPVGVIVGIYLSERVASKFAQTVKVAVDMLQGVPSIIFGIVVNLWFVKTFKTYGAIFGSLSLAIMMLPIVIKNTEETLKLIPYSLREAALALGAPYYRVILKVVLPAGLSGIITGALIGVSRIVGETAPLLFTSFGSRFLNFRLNAPMETLPTLIYKNSMSPNTNLISNSWGASLVLVLFVLLLNVITKAVVRKWKIRY